MMPRLRFPADLAVGTLDWPGSEAQAPVLARGDVLIPRGAEVSLDVEIITSVRRFDPGEDAPAWIELGGVTVTGAAGYSVEGSGQPVHLGFLRELPGDSITDLHLSWHLIPESPASSTHLSPGLRRLYLAQTALEDDALTLVAHSRALTNLQTWVSQPTDAAIRHPPP